ncbi:MAG: hypothetical protein J6L73_03285 [Muribaculaceae bacterium]|nr:hypothetical protein [Muribaculaceae bacterium]
MEKVFSRLMMAALLLLVMQTASGCLKKPADSGDSATEVSRHVDLLNEAKKEMGDMVMVSDIQSISDNEFTVNDGESDIIYRRK